MDENTGVATIQIRDVPEDIRKKLRMLCLRENVSMNRKLIELIEQYVEREVKNLGEEWLEEPK